MRFLRSAVFLICSSAAFAQPHHWTEAEAKEWYAKQPWLVGANYVPAFAENQLEMWQADTFDPVLMDRELGWAEGIGFNTLRVFLHDLPWNKDASAFEHRINTFLKLCDKHHIRPILVLFDSVWNPFPEPGPQQAPRPGIHNSRWVQSPGANVLRDPNQFQRALEYVQKIILDFSRDKRILAWDVWNEPENPNEGSYGKEEIANKSQLVATLLPRVFEYARAGVGSQPLTSGLWTGDDWSNMDKLTPIQKIQLENSDIISFHNYEGPANFEKHVVSLEKYQRPIFCTEYMARPRGSTFQAILPIAKKYNVAAYNWGLVQGKSQTYLPWDSWQHPYVNKQPDVWFHDVFKANGVPYSPEEVAFIRQITGRGSKAKGAAK
ncbi:MAG TPA: hypothetical protein VN736_25200 [Candidatus Limnocylindrales bacterium]|nr:hypothetical protein [Candidatus Limnocylindrales bacterium]